MLEAFGLKGVDFLLQSRKDKPKKDLLRALGTLRRDMMDVRVNYSEFDRSRNINPKERRQQTAPGGYTGDPKEAWIDSLRRLHDDIRQIDSVLRIYGPETHRDIIIYAGGDPAADGEVAELFPAADSFYQSLGVDVASGTTEPKFSAVLSRLDAFIKETFKPEEVFAALQSVKR